MVQPHLKMFRLRATTRVMCGRHLPHDWDATAFAPVPCWAQLLFQKGGSASSAPPLEYLCFPSSFPGMVLLSSASFLRERIDLLLLLVVPPSSLSFEWHPTRVVHVWDVVRWSRFPACDSRSELSCVALCRSTVIFSDKQNWWKAPRQRHSHKAEALGRLTAFAVPSASALPSSTATFEEFSATAIGVSAARFFLGAGAFLTQVQGHTRKCAWPFWLPSFATFRRALQKGAAFAGSARGVPSDKGFRNRRGH